MFWGKCDTATFFHQLQQILIVKYFYIWCKFRIFSLLLIARTELKEKMPIKIANSFYLKVPKLANLVNQNKEKSEIINSSPYKKKQY